MQQISFYGSKFKLFSYWSLLCSCACYVDKGCPNKNALLEMSQIFSLYETFWTFTIIFPLSIVTTYKKRKMSVQIFTKAEYDYELRYFSWHGDGIGNYSSIPNR